MTKRIAGKAYIVGSGIAGLACAVFLIKDAGMKGSDIFIIDRDDESGGGFDGRGSAEKGYFSRGYRMFEESVYLSTYDLLSKIPSPENPDKNLKDDFFEFNDRVKAKARARLMKNGEIADFGRMELGWRDRLALVKLLYFPEKFFESKKIGDYFSNSFFESNFWILWSTTLAFTPDHSLAEMRRYLSRFIHDAPRFDTMTGVLSAPYCEHDFFVVPVLKFLRDAGVNFLHGREVTDLKFNDDNGKKSVTAILCGGMDDEKIPVTPNDKVFVTNGSMMTDATIGSMESPPSSVKKSSASWDLWKNMAVKWSDLGNPAAFCGFAEKSGWESFTITFRDSVFFDLVKKLTGNAPGTGGLITFKDSNWLITLAIPHQPYFINQPADTFVCWGYGLYAHREGNYVKKKMSECGGKEIMRELCGHLGFDAKASEIIKSAVCIPCFMPFITAQFMPRKKSDRPAVVPSGSQNLACIGQFVEIPREIVFTVECSIRSAKIAVKKLYNLPCKIPRLHQRKYNPKTGFEAIMKTLR